MSKANTFSAEVRKLVTDRHMDYIDAVVHWCQMNNFEVEYAANLIKRDPFIKSRLQIEAEDLNFLKKGARLPL